MQKSQIILCSLSLAACSGSEPRSHPYFQANLEEARAVSANCQEGSSNEEDCANAGIAIKIDEDRKRFERFRGK